MHIRKITSEDYPKVEELIKKSILKTVSKDYTAEAITIMLESDPYQPEKTKDERDYYVACDPHIVGIIGRKDNNVKTFFVDPLKQGTGVGTRLILFIESLIQADGFDECFLNSTVTAKSFYEKQKYTVLQEEKVKRGNSILTKYAMKKSLV